MKVVVVFATPRGHYEDTTSYLLGIVEADRKTDTAVESFIDDAVEREDSQRDHYSFDFVECDTEWPEWKEMPKLA